MASSSRRDAAGRRGGYTSLNLNQSYKGTRTDSGKSYGKSHGMQSLGKVSASSRRVPAPASLPSLRSENAGNDPTIALVPTGGGGWRSSKDEGERPREKEEEKPKPVKKIEGGSVDGRSAPSAVRKGPPQSPGRKFKVDFPSLEEQESMSRRELDEWERRQREAEGEGGERSDARGLRPSGEKGWKDSPHSLPSHGPGSGRPPPHGGGPYPPQHGPFPPHYNAPYMMPPPPGHGYGAPPMHGPGRPYPPPPHGHGPFHGPPGPHGYPPSNPYQMPDPYHVSWKGGERGKESGRPPTVREDDIKNMDVADDEEGGWAGHHEEIDYTKEVVFEDSSDEEASPKRDKSRRGGRQETEASRAAKHSPNKDQKPVGPELSSDHLKDSEDPHREGGRGEPYPSDTRPPPSYQGAPYPPYPSYPPSYESYRGRSAPMYPPPPPGSYPPHQVYPPPTHHYGPPPQRGWRREGSERDDGPSHPDYPQSWGQEPKRRWSEDGEKSDERAKGGKVRERPRILAKSPVERKESIEGDEPTKGTDLTIKRTASSSSDSRDASSKPHVSFADEQPGEALSPTDEHLATTPSSSSSSLTTRRGPPKKIIMRKMSGEKESAESKAPLTAKDRQEPPLAKTTKERPQDLKPVSDALDSPSSKLPDAEAKNRQMAWNVKGRGPISSKTLYEPEGKESAIKFKKYQHQANEPREREGRRSHTARRGSDVRSPSPTSARSPKEKEVVVGKEIEEPKSESAASPSTPASATKKDEEDRWVWSVGDPIYKKDKGRKAEPSVRQQHTKEKDGQHVDSRDRGRLRRDDSDRERPPPSKRQELTTLEREKQDYTLAKSQEQGGASTDPKTGGRDTKRHEPPSAKNKVFKTREFVRGDHDRAEKDRGSKEERNSGPKKPEQGPRDVSRGNSRKVDRRMSDPGESQHPQNRRGWDTPKKQDQSAQRGESASSAKRKSWGHGGGDGRQMADEGAAPVHSLGTASSQKLPTPTQQTNSDQDTSLIKKREQRPGTDHQPQSITPGDKSDMVSAALPQEEKGGTKEQRHDRRRPRDQRRDEGRRTDRLPSDKSHERAQKPGDRERNREGGRGESGRDKWRESGRDGGREGRREGGRGEGGRDGGRGESGREGGREGGKDGGREGGREGGRGEGGRGESGREGGSKGGRRGRGGGKRDHQERDTVGRVENERERGERSTKQQHSGRQHQLSLPERHLDSAKPDSQSQGKDIPPSRERTDRRLPRDGGGRQERSERGSQGRNRQQQSKGLPNRPVEQRRNPEHKIEQRRNPEQKLEQAVGSSASGKSTLGYAELEDIESGSDWERECEENLKPLKVPSDRPEQQQLEPSTSLPGPLQVPPGRSAQHDDISTERKTGHPKSDRPPRFLGAGGSRKKPGRDDRLDSKEREGAEPSAGRELRKGSGRGKGRSDEGRREGGHRDKSESSRPGSYSAQRKVGPSGSLRDEARAERRGPKTGSDSASDLQESLTKTKSRPATVDKKGEVHSTAEQKALEFQKYDLNNTRIAIVDNIGGQRTDEEPLSPSVDAEFTEVKSKKDKREKHKKEKEEQQKIEEEQRKLEEERQHRSQKAQKSLGQSDKLATSQPSSAWGANGHKTSVVPAQAVPWSSTVSTLPMTTWSSTLPSSNAAPGSHLKAAAITSSWTPMMMPPTNALLPDPIPSDVLGTSSAWCSGILGGIILSTSSAPLNRGMLDAAVDSKLTEETSQQLGGVAGEERPAASPAPASGRMTASREDVMDKTKQVQGAVGEGVSGETKRAVDKAKEGGGVKEQQQKNGSEVALPKSRKNVPPRFQSSRSHQSGPGRGRGAARNGGEKREEKAVGGSKSEKNEGRFYVHPKSRGDTSSRPGSVGQRATRQSHPHKPQPSAVQASELLQTEPKKSAKVTVVTEAKDGGLEGSGGFSIPETDPQQTSAESPVSCTHSSPLPSLSSPLLDIPATHQPLQQYQRAGNSQASMPQPIQQPVRGSQPSAKLQAQSTDHGVVGRPQEVGRGGGGVSVGVHGERVVRTNVSPSSTGVDDGANSSQIQGQRYSGNLSHSSVSSTVHPPRSRAQHSARNTPSGRSGRSGAPVGGGRSHARGTAPNHDVRRSGEGSRKAVGHSFRESRPGGKTEGSTTVQTVAAITKTSHTFTSRPVDNNFSYAAALKAPPHVESVLANQSSPSRLTPVENATAFVTKSQDSSRSNTPVILAALAPGATQATASVGSSQIAEVVQEPGSKRSLSLQNSPAGSSRPGTAQSDRERSDSFTMPEQAPAVQPLSLALEASGDLSMTEDFSRAGEVHEQLVIQLSLEQNCEPAQPNSSVGHAGNSPLLQPQVHPSPTQVHGHGDASAELVSHSPLREEERVILAQAAGQGPPGTPPKSPIKQPPPGLTPSKAQFPPTTLTSPLPSGPNRDFFSQQENVPPVHMQAPPQQALFPLPHAPNTSAGTLPLGPATQQLPLYNMPAVPAAFPHQGGAVTSATATVVSPARPEGHPISATLPFSIPNNHPINYSGLRSTAPPPSTVFPQSLAASMPYNVVQQQQHALLVQKQAAIMLQFFKQQQIAAAQHSFQQHQQQQYLQRQQRHLHSAPHHPERKSSLPSNFAGAISPGSAVRSSPRDTAITSSLASVVQPNVSSPGSVLAGSPGQIGSAFTPYPKAVHMSQHHSQHQSSSASQVRHSPNFSQTSINQVPPSIDPTTSSKAIVKTESAEVNPSRRAESNSRDRSQVTEPKSSFNISAMPFVPAGATTPSNSRQHTMLHKTSGSNIHGVDAAMLASTRQPPGLERHMTNLPGQVMFPSVISQLRAAQPYHGLAATPPGSLIPSHPLSAGPVVGPPHVPIPLPLPVPSPLASSHHQIPPKTPLHSTVFTNLPVTQPMRSLDTPHDAVQVIKPGDLPARPYKRQVNLEHASSRSKHTASYPKENHAMRMQSFVEQANAARFARNFTAATMKGVSSTASINQRAHVAAATASEAPSRHVSGGIQTHPSVSKANKPALLPTPTGHSLVTPSAGVLAANQAWPVNVHMPPVIQPQFAQDSRVAFAAAPFGGGQM